MTNPFLDSTNPITGEPMGAVTAQDRIEMVRGFGIDECQQALLLPDLQITVHAALAKRLRLLNSNRYAALQAGGVEGSGTG